MTLLLGVVGLRVCASRRSGRTSSYLKHALPVLSWLSSLRLALSSFGVTSLPTIVATASTDAELVLIQHGCCRDSSWVC